MNLTKQITIFKACEDLNLKLFNTNKLFIDFLFNNYSDNLYTIIYKDLDNNQLILKDEYLSDTITLIKTTKEELEIFIIIHESPNNNAKAIYQFFQNCNNDKLYYTETEVFTNNNEILIRNSNFNGVGNKIIEQSREKIKGEKKYMEQNKLNNIDKLINDINQNSVKILTKKKRKYLNFDNLTFFTK